MGIQVSVTFLFHPALNIRIHSSSIIKDKFTLEAAHEVSCPVVECRKAPTKSMIRNFVKICVETGNVDVVGRVYRSTALDEVRVAWDSD
jgi:hypothetical protein